MGSEYSVKSSKPSRILFISEKKFQDTIQDFPIDLVLKLIL